MAVVEINSYHESDGIGLGGRGMDYVETIFTRIFFSFFFPGNRQKIMKFLLEFLVWLKRTLKCLVEGHLRKVVVYLCLNCTSDECLSYSSIGTGCQRVSAVNGQTVGKS